MSSGLASTAPSTPPDTSEMGDHDEQTNVGESQGLLCLKHVGSSHLFSSRIFLSRFRLEAKSVVLLVLPVAED